MIALFDEMSSDRKTDEQEMETPSESHTIFDDVYRTLSIKGTRLMIPLINYMFDKNYAANEDICVLPNETFLSPPASEKRITDSFFQVGEKNLFQLYIVEEQTNAAKNMPLRLYEYMFAHASMMLRETYEQGIAVLPSVGVLNLRGNNEIRKMQVLHDGKTLDITMKSLDLQNFHGVEQLEEKGLYCLMPYYLFMLEDKMKASGTPEAIYLSELEDYSAVMERAVRNSIISPDDMVFLDELRHNVRDGLHLEKMGLDVGRLEHMGGKVLEMKYEKVFQDKFNEGEARGISIGEARGEARGEANERMRTVCRMFSKDKCLALVADATDFPMNELKEFEKQYKTDPKAFLTKYGYSTDSAVAQR